MTLEHLTIASQAIILFLYMVLIAKNTWNYLSNLNCTPSEEACNNCDCVSGTEVIITWLFCLVLYFAGAFSKFIPSING